MSHVKKILLSDVINPIFKSKYKFDDGDILDSLAKINIFIGPTNSGKSRLLRGLASIKKIKFEVDEKKFEKINGLLEDYKKQMTHILHHNNLVSYDNITEQAINDIHAIKILQEAENPLSSFDNLVTMVEAMVGQRNISYKPNGLQRINSSSKNIELGEEIKLCTQQFNEGINELRDNTLTDTFKIIYIPILRGLRHLTDEKHDEYHSKTEKDYFLNLNNTQKKPTIYTGLFFYQEIFKLLTTSYDTKQILENYQKFLSNDFFENKKVTITTREADKTLCIKIGKEAEQPIHQLGDGIQSIILITLPLFLNQNKKALVFIEEPELLIHPGLQRTLIKVFNRKEFSKFQYFFTTHSNHFIDLTLDELDSSIFTIKKELSEQETTNVLPNFYVENLSSPNSNLLESMGIKNSSVLLTNCTIWVEGITDRRYFRHYLKLYQNNLKIGKEYKEDIHYSFVEYSGNNITHWSFLDNEENPINIDRLCGRSILITDKDSNKKLPRQKKLEEKLGDRYICLPCKEIENLLTPDIIKKIIKEYEKTTGGLPNEGFKWSDYKNKYLGTFIEENILKNDKKRLGSYKLESGTISDKNKFCDKALKNIKSIDDLNSETVKICETIYKFIEESNK